MFKAWQKYLAEMLGTAILVFMGCGSAVILGCSTFGGHLAVALAFGLAIVATAYVIGNVSGCHINPAVSLAVFLNKKMSAKDFICYVVSQVIGGVIGGVLLLMLTNFGVVDMTGGLGSNGVDGAGGIWGALFIEIILTFIFVFTVLGVAADENKAGVGGIVIGLTLTFVHIVGIPLTGTSVNPARSIGPAIFASGDTLSSLWVFILAPLVGAAGAAFVFRCFKKRDVRN